jgi:hypothetical protein
MYLYSLQGKLALCASTHRFVTAVQGKRLIAASDKAKENEIFNVRGTCSRWAWQGLHH